MHKSDRGVNVKPAAIHRLALCHNSPANNRCWMVSMMMKEAVVLIHHNTCDDYRVLHIRIYGRLGLNMHGVRKGAIRQTIYSQFSCVLSVLMKLKPFHFIFKKSRTKKKETYDIGRMTERR